jgi:PIN domain nuclease of toxin-antitoxin system
VGERLERDLNAYLDTGVAVWLSERKLSSLSKDAKGVLRRADLLISPIVLIELEILYEIRRIVLRSREIQMKLEHELSVQVCGFSFPSIAQAALNEKWTRDPFDRIIVAHAKANGFAALISADEHIAKHYSRTVW